MASFSNLHSQWITYILKSEISRGQIFFKSPKLKVVTEKVFFLSYFHIFNSNTLSCKTSFGF